MADLEAQENNEALNGTYKNNDLDPLIVNGIRYATAADASTAGEELKKIDYIESRLNYSNPEEVLAIYDKMIGNKLFVTPSGFAFLGRVRTYLLDRPEIDDSRIRPIETDSLFTQRAINEVRSAARPVSSGEGKRELEKARTNLRISIILNIMLVILVGAMFAIALGSDNPNILNYKNALEDQYSDWEQDLQEREAAVKEKERELGMDNAGVNDGQD